MQDDNILEFRDVVSSLNVILKDHASYLDKSAESLSKYNKGFAVLPSEYTKQQEKIKQNNEALAASQAKITAGLQNTVNALLKEVEALKKKQVEQGKGNKLTAEEVVNNRVLNTEKQRQAVINAELTNDYEKMNAQMNLQIRAAQGMAVQLLRMAEAGEQLSPEYRKLANEIDRVQMEVTEADAALKKIDASLGRHQRNVGNYKSAYNGLGNSINQLSRELPAFTFSIQTGFLALSNNIPILADEIGRLKRENIELAASGQPVVSVTKQIVSALFSWQTAMSLTITLLTIFAPKIGEFISSLFGMEKAFNDVTDAQERFKNTIAKSLQGAEKELTTFTRLREVMRDLTKGYDERLNAAERYKAAYPGFLKDMTAEQILMAESGKSTKEYNAILIDLTATIKKREDAKAKQTAADKTFEDLTKLKEEFELRNRVNKEIDQGNIGLEAWKKKISDRVDLVNDNEEFVTAFGKADIDALGYYDERQINQLKIRYNALLREYNAEKKKVNKAFLETSLLDFKPEKKEKDPKEKAKKDAKDYLAIQYEILKAQLENQIKYNTAIMNDETKTYEQRKNAALALSGDKMRLAQLEYDEEIRLGELKTKNELAQNAEDLKNHRKDTDDRVAIVKEGEDRALLAFIRLADRRKEISEETAKYLKGVEERIADQVSKNIVTQDQLDNIRQLNLLLANVTTATSAEDFKKIEDLKIQIAEGTTEKLINIERERKAAQIQEYNDLFNKRAELEKRLGELLSSGVETEENSAKIEAIKNELSATIGMYEKDSEAYNKLIDEKIQLDKQLEDLKTRQHEKEVARIKELQAATDQYLKSVTDSFLNNAGLSNVSMFFDKTFDTVTGKWQTTFERLFEGADSTLEKFQVTFQAITAVGMQAFDFLTQGSRNFYEQEMAGAQRAHDAAIVFAGDSAIAKKEIEDQYEKRRQDIEKKKAKSEKDNALFKAIINTAQAIVAALPNIPLSVIVGAIGAAQIAAIASQPVPQFEYGGEHKGGAMLVNDGKGSKYRETVVTPDGKVIKPQGRNVLMHAPRGTRIYTQDQWERDQRLNDLLQDNGISPVSDMVVAAPPISGRDEPAPATAAEIDAIMAEHLGNLEFPGLELTDSELRKFHTKNGQRTYETNQRASGNGISV